MFKNSQSNISKQFSSLCSSSSSFDTFELHAISDSVSLIIPSVCHTSLNNLLLAHKPLIKNSTLLTLLPAVDNLSPPRSPLPPFNNMI